MTASATPSDHRPIPRLPTGVLVAAAAFLVVNVLAMFAGAVTNSATLDEPAHVYRLQGLLENGWYVKDKYVVDGQVTQDGAYVYAPVVALIGHALNVLVGIEGWSTVSESAPAYTVRHLVIASLGLMGLVAVASMARLLLRSWRWGILAAATLSAIPVYIGHAMFNIKDLPVAAGYTVATLGAVALTRPGIASRRVATLAAGCLALGIWIAAGVHPAMLAGIGASVVVALAMAWASTSRDDPTARAVTRRRMLVAAAGCAIGYLALIASYPNLFLRPDLMYHSVLDSGHFPYSAKTLTAGTFTEAAAPWYYLPIWFAAQTPIVISVLCLGAIGWFLRTQLRAARRGARDRDLLAGTAVVLVQAMFLPWVAIGAGSTLYQGARQMLFVVPAMAMLATIGTWLLTRRAATSGRRPGRSTVMAAVVVGLAVPTATSAALFPYEYTWFNAATALRPVDGNWTLDYEWASSREVLPKIDTLDRGRCVILQPNPTCNRHQLIPNHDTLGRDLDGRPLAMGEMWRIRYAGGVARSDAPSVDYALATDCRRETAITRRLFWRQVTLSLVERCWQ
jgi:hypothetical protein